MSTTELAALGLLAPSKALKSRAVPQTPRATYRVFLHALRHLRDPHVWLIATTHIRSLLKTANKPLPINLPEESEELEVLKTQKERATKHIKAELNKVRAAVACHPHALMRLIEESYGMRGRVKWELIKNVTLSAPLPKEDWPEAVLAKNPNPETRYPPMQLQPLPPSLRPLMRKYVNEPAFPRARTKIPPVVLRRAALKEWEWGWANVSVPLILGPNEDGAGTGWEKMGVVETFRQMAGLEDPPSTLPLPRRQRRALAARAVEDRPPADHPVEQSPAEDQPAQPTPSQCAPAWTTRGAALPSFKNLPGGLQRAFPKRPPSAYRSPPHFPRPRASLTRDQPNTWSHARDMTPRLVRRIYKQAWDRLEWVAHYPYKQKSSGIVGGWRKSEWEMVATGKIRSGLIQWREGASRWTVAGERDLKWLETYELEGQWDARQKVRAASQKALKEQDAN